MPGAWETRPPLWAYPVTHTCHALGCSLEVPPQLLFCRPHWFTCSPEVRNLIWTLYRPGQESDKRPSRAYLIAQRLAVAEVAYREDRITADQAIQGVEEVLDLHAYDLRVDEVNYLASVIPYAWVDYALRLNDIPF